MRLQREGAEVTVLDREPDLNGGTTPHFMAGDASDPQTVEVALLASEADVVYHLAANSDIAAGVHDASLDFRDTLMTTVALRQALARRPVEQVVFASSSAIFGVLDGPAAESIDAFADPVSWYGRGKLASEFVLESLTGPCPKARILMVRFPNVVGPLATHGVVFDFVQRLHADPLRLDVLGDGHQTKPYVHVSDVVSGIEFFRERAHPGITRVNLGPPDTVSVREIAAIVADVMGVDPDIRYQDSPTGWPGDVPRYSFDASLMRDSGFTIDATSAEAVRRAARDLLLERTGAA